MKVFKSGVGYYTTGTIEIHFPEDDVACMHCPLLGKERGTDREYCKRTGYYLPAYENSIDMHCPINFIKENNDG